MGKTNDTELTDKQLAFATEYVANGGNGKQAAIDTGYSENSSEAQASRLLRNAKVIEKIATLRGIIVDKANLRATDLIEGLKAVGFSNITDYLKEDMSLEDLKALPKEITSAIHSIKIKEINISDNVTQNVIEFKLHDKIRAMDALGKHFGIYEEHNKQKNNELDLGALSNSELLQLLALQEKAKKSSGDITA